LGQIQEDEIDGEREIKRFGCGAEREEPQARSEGISSAFRNQQRAVH
jgi:hypothetical protein